MNHTKEPLTDNTNEDVKEKTYTNTNGCPVFNPYASMQVGKPGPLLIGDPHLVDLFAHFDRERIPERVVHARGSGAYGEFEVTDDVSDICTAKFLQGVGKKTRVNNRFSTVEGERGTADCIRDVRGFSVKLHTEEGQLDWVFIHTPVFFTRDPNKFIFFNHIQKLHPQTNLPDATMFWDGFVQNHEALHEIMMVFSDRGTPYSWRHIHGFGAHTYKWIAPDGSFNFVKIHLKTDQGIKTFNEEESVRMAGVNPSHAQEDLFRSIERGEFPSWTCYVQVMSPEEAKKQDFSVYDMTKTWPQAKYPLRRFGKLTLNRNPENYFAEVEQAAFSPANLVPGWEASFDPVLQMRLFAYADTQRHRLGPNFDQIPINYCPFKYNPFQRDGTMSVRGNYGSAPNYPSSYAPLNYSQERDILPTGVKTEDWNAEALAFHWDFQAPRDLVQVKELWDIYGKTGQQDALVNNVSSHVKNAREETRERVYEMFGSVDPECGKRIRELTEQKLKSK